MTHIMLDLETWGTRPGAALRSIGAIVFDPNSDGVSSNIGVSFYRNIDKDSCVINGLTVDPDTVAWWERQAKEAIHGLAKDQKLLIEVVREFHDWFRLLGARYIWCQGANFDEPLWTAAARAVDQFVPWKYWDVRCTRTIYAAADFDPRSVPRQGTYHNALDDAAYQARCVQMAFAKLRAPKVVGWGEV